ncbi:hypothetical protein [Streptomyces acidiscabies]|uniref:hypothetical protein n=1 Tax=Streptomyces acidiscabies TaxID=42234 RepID=UPI0038F5E6CF
MSIIHAFVRWVLGVLTPGSGKRRAGSRPVPERPVRHSEVSRPGSVRLPAHRSPYGLHGPVDGAGTPLVRPYVLEAERSRERQARRRIALVLAADFGIDLDRHVIGAEGVA